MLIQANRMPTGGIQMTLMSWESAKILQRSCISLISFGRYSQLRLIRSDQSLCIHYALSRGYPGE